MTTLIVVESAFGNTRRVAEAIAEGIGAQARVVRADNAPASIPEGVDLLLVGAPTHAFHLPTDSSRKEAVNKGAAEVQAAGLAEWIATLEARTALRAIAFDTVVKQPRVMSALGSASARSARLLRDRGFLRVERGPSFLVTGTAGPLAEGELERARRWGASLRQVG